MQKTIRYRASISTSTKGVKSPDCTVEITEVDDGLIGLNAPFADIEAEILKSTDSLAKKLAKLYPVEGG